MQLAITEKFNKFSCNPVFMKIRGEVFAFVLVIL